MRFQPPAGVTPMPYIASAGMNHRWLASGLDDSLRWVDPLKSEDASFCVALNRANCLAHDGTVEPGGGASALGMPPWVMLDCCLLTSAMVGFDLPRAAFPDALASQLDPEERCERLAVSEYVALPSAEPGRSVGVSLFSLASGHGLGVRSKALGLLVAGCTELIGVTQYANPGVAVHLKFGPLALVAQEVAVHSRAEETFIYRLDVPEATTLKSMAFSPTSSTPPTVEINRGDWDTVLEIDPRVASERQRAKLLAAEQRLWVVDCGRVEEGALTSITLARPR